MSKKKIRNNRDKNSEDRDEGFSDWGFGNELKKATIYFTKDIEYDTVEEFSKELDSTYAEEIEIHFASYGGNPNAVDSLIRIVNNHEKDITIVLIGEAISAGFLFINDCTRPILIGDSAYGMIHYGDTTLSARELLDQKSYSSFTLREMDVINRRMLAAAKELGVSEEDIEAIKHGKDLYVSNELMREWFHSYEEKDEDHEDDKLAEKVADLVMDKLSKAGYVRTMDSLYPLDGNPVIKTEESISSD